MMEIGSGERTERQWHALLESAGLQIVDMYWAVRSAGVGNKSQRMACNRAVLMKGTQRFTLQGS
jgi:hypothetical protein